MSSPFATIRDDFFANHLAANPEEGSTLGLREHAGRLSDPSADAARAELARLRETLRALENVAIDTLADDALRLDLDATLRAARFHARYLENDMHVTNLELAAFPNGAMQHAALHARSVADHADVVGRCRAVPAFLDAHRRNLARGRAEGRLPARPAAAAFVERVLPGAASSTRALGTEGVVPPDVATAASEAFLGFARFLEEEIVPTAPALLRLGPEETAFRLRDVMGIEASIDELLTRAKGALADAHRRMMHYACVSKLADAREAVMALFTAKPATIEEALASYRRETDAATRLVKERGLVPVPDDLALDLAPLPAGMADGAGFQNWPAPLLEREGRGHALYAKDPAAHPKIMAKQLAVHECIPGHYLQSVIWQRRLCSSPERAVRFLGVMDDVAMSRGYFGTMVSVEGWAVAMEHLLREQGFFEEGPELLFLAWCNAIHAIRVLLDLELHAGDRDWDALVRMVADATLMSDGWASAQVIRSLRIPLQSSTYLIGAQEILQLRKRSPIPTLKLHEALLDLGPVPISRVRE
jgi:uncharacterized protein (DUF885 family)